MPDKSFRYSDAGVDIDAGNKAVDLMRSHVKSTWGREVLNDLGSFGSLFSLDVNGYTSPVLVSGTDGVGTKLKVAFMAEKHDTVGIDAVAMCVNDILAQGASPLFFLDYLALGKNIPEKVEEIVKGLSIGCRQAGCALIGGETAEMPGIYDENEYDIAGFAVGIVDRKDIIDGSGIGPGDQVIGLASSGLHSNGYSLVRKLLFESYNYNIDDYIDELGRSLREELLTPTKIYGTPVLKVISRLSVEGIAHITGGGLVENLERILPGKCDAVIDKNSWNSPPVFNWLKELGEIEEKEMMRTFNNGIGLALVVKKENVKLAAEILKEQQEEFYFIGSIEPGGGNVQIV